MVVFPDFSFEKKALKSGHKIIAGADEVGRGAFAGSVVAACVVFDTKTILTLQGLPLQGGGKIIVNDSKKLSARQREIADVWIKENAFAFGIGVSDVAKINKFGIKKATEIAFRKAISEANRNIEFGTSNIDYLLIDAFYIPYIKGLKKDRQKAIVKGDSSSFSIAAASIVAKVFRDNLMTKLSNSLKFKKYRWDKNKGYGTSQHREAIFKYGITTGHRKKFVNTWVKNSKIQNNNA